MREVTVRVTRKLIDWALTQTSTQCAIALALKDAGVDYPRVTQDKIAFTDRSTGERYTYDTPEKLAKFIDQFDRDPSKCKPVTFTVDLDTPAKVRPVKRMQPSEVVARHREYEENKGNVSRARTPHKAASNIYRPLRMD